MNSFASPLELRDNGDETFTLIKPFTLCTDSDCVTVPRGFVTDFASVPRLFWNIIAPYGKHGKAAVAHDFVYSREGNGGRTRAQCDQLFLQGMLQLGVRKTRAYIMFAAVRAFGWTEFCQ